MDYLHAAKRLNELYKKYVGGGLPDAGKLVVVIKREALVLEQGKVKGTRGLLRELRNDRKEASSIHKYLGKR